jgi:hypothetical protein
MFDRFSPSTRRVARVIFGLAASGGLSALAGILGFIGLWEYAGFETIPGEPGLGLLVLAAAVSSLFASGMAFAWAVTRRPFVETKVFGAGLAAIGVAVTIWFTSAN